MTEAVRALVPFGFETLTLTRLHGGHIAGNPASGRVMLKAGFKPTGRYRIDNWRDGQPAWAAEYEILKPYVRSHTRFGRSKME